jgi:hypothetical protein
MSGYNRLGEFSACAHYDCVARIAGSFAQKPFPNFLVASCSDIKPYKLRLCAPPSGFLLHSSLPSRPLGAYHLRYRSYRITRLRQYTNQPSSQTRTTTKWIRDVQHLAGRRPQATRLLATSSRTIMARMPGLWRSLWDLK